MELLDNSEQQHSKTKEAEHKLLYYFIYSMSLGLLVLGSLGAVKIGLLDDYTLLNTYWGLVWIGVIFIMTIVFYRKVLTNTWKAIIWVVFAFFCSFWVTGYLVDTVFDVSREEPILAGIIMYISHWAVSIAVAGLHYAINKS